MATTEIAPDEVAGFADKIGQRAAEVATFDGQLLETAFSGNHASSELDKALRIDPVWFGGPMTPWLNDVEIMIHSIYDSRNHEALRIHEELTGIETDLKDFVVRWNDNQEATVFEFNNASDAE